LQECSFEELLIENLKEPERKFKQHGKWDDGGWRYGTMSHGTAPDHRVQDHNLLLHL